MKTFNFIELPKEEVVKKSDLPFLEGADNCFEYTACTDPKGGKQVCMQYDSDPCSCGGGLYTRP